MNMGVGPFGLVIVDTPDVSSNGTRLAVDPLFGCVLTVTVREEMQEEKQKEE